jgi:NAD(P)-dependent dehydrogenase (short-subunit alcohol dehydrogenase family)
MSTIPSPIHREPELGGQTVVVIGGSSGIGFETARRARAEGAKVILTGRNAERLQHAAGEVDALSTRPSTPRILWLSSGSSATSRQSTT